MAVHQESYEVFQDLSRYKQQILEAIDRFGETSVAQRFSLEEIRSRLKQETFELLVVGQFKRGKSYLINALLGEDLLPTGVVPLTSIVTVITYGDKISASVFFTDGSFKEIAIEDLNKYVTEIENPKNEKNVREVWITFPSDYLRGGVRLIDTPGVGSFYRHNTDVAYKYLPKSDAAIFVLSVDQPAGEAEIEFLKDVRGFAHKIFFVLNKIDIIPKTELDMVVSFTKKVLEEATGKEAKIFPISAKWALEARKNGHLHLLNESGIQAFTIALENFLVQEKGLVILCSNTHRILWYLSEAALSLELERKALLSPIEEFKQKLSVFERKKSEMSSRIGYLNSMVDHTIKNVILKQLDEDLKSFKHKLTEQIRSETLKIFETNKEGPLEALNETLKRHVTDRLYESYISWFEKEKEFLGQKLGEIFEPIRKEMDNEIKELVKFSSDLFEISSVHDRFSLDKPIREGRVFRIKEEPMALEFLDSVLTEKVPGWVSRRFIRLKTFLEQKAKERILKRWLNHLVDMADIYNGRVRFAITRFIQEHVELFRREMTEGISRTIRSLSDAISKGLELKEKGEREAKERLHVIERELSLVNLLRTDLGDLYQRISFSA
ncbi:MAG: dynamin family protein [Syntrophobacterales bacterium]|nr:dynamin family protein [Syntrophobacterales bacterium]